MTWFGARVGGTCAIAAELVSSNAMRSNLRIMSLLSNNLPSAFDMPSPVLDIWIGWQEPLPARDGLLYGRGNRRRHRDIHATGTLPLHLLDLVDRLLHGLIAATRQ